MTDAEAWKKYPQHRQWFNKLFFSSHFRYNCGPGGVAPTKSGWYCVRPIYNLSGMGIGARKQWIEEGDIRSVEPGYFWCEWFDGPQLSVTYTWTYKWEGWWEPESVWEGFNSAENLSRFSKWEKRDAKSAPKFNNLHELRDVGLINVEFIGSKPIEVHLRPSPDPQNCNRIVPVWSDDVIEGYEPDFEDADGHLEVPRLGFIVD